MSNVPIMTTLQKKQYLISRIVEYRIVHKFTLKGQTFDLNDSVERLEEAVNSLKAMHQHQQDREVGKFYSQMLTYMKQMIMQPEFRHFKPTFDNLLTVMAQKYPECASNDSLDPEKHS